MLQGGESTIKFEFRDVAQVCKYDAVLGNSFLNRLLRHGWLCLLIAAAPIVVAQRRATTGGEQQPVHIDEEEVAAHRIGTLQPIVIHLVGGPAELRHMAGPIPVEVTVDASGNVVSTTVDGDMDDDDVPKQWIAEFKRVAGDAEKQVRALRYRPFERNGQAVAAAFEESVPFIPPDMGPGPHVDFPEIHQWKSLVMTLDRTGCFGACPSYSIEVHGDGTVLYNGRGYVAIAGQHRGTISQDNVLALLNAFRIADYFSLRERYVAGITDSATYTTSIRFDGHQKKVVDYVGQMIGMPQAVTDLEVAFDRIADSARWTKGDAATVAALRDEGWDFKSQAAANTLARLAEKGTADAVCDLVAAGVPADGSASTQFMSPRPSNRYAFLPVVTAAGRGNLDMLRCLLQRPPADDPVVLAGALSAAARAGQLDVMKLLFANGADVNVHATSVEPVIVAAAASGVPAVVEEILKHHPDLTARDAEDRTALIAAVDRGYSVSKSVNRLDVVRLLVGAGADVNARDNKGNTPLIENAWDPQIAEFLLSHGADVNAANDEGWTALFSASAAPLARVLLQHGADIGIKNRKGDTALQSARSYGNPEIVRVLEAAQASKLTPSPR